MVKAKLKNGSKNGNGSANVQQGKKTMQAGIRKAIKGVNDYIDLLRAMPFEFGQAGSASSLYENYQGEIWNLANGLDPEIAELTEKLTKYRRLEDDVQWLKHAAMMAGFHIGVMLGVRVAGYSERQLDEVGSDLLRAKMAAPRFSE